MKIKFNFEMTVNVNRDILRDEVKEYTNGKIEELLMLSPDMKTVENRIKELYEFDTVNIKSVEVED